jgi:hypothetical protein
MQCQYEQYVTPGNRKRNVPTRGRRIDDAIVNAASSLIISSIPISVKNCRIPQKAGLDIDRQKRTDVMHSSFVLPVKKVTGKILATKLPESMTTSIKRHLGVVHSTVKVHQWLPNRPGGRECLLAGFQHLPTKHRHRIGIGKCLPRYVKHVVWHGVLIAGICR